MADGPPKPKTTTHPKKIPSAPSFSVSITPATSFQFDRNTMVYIFLVGSLAAMSPPRAAKFASGSDTRLRLWDGACVKCYFSLQRFECVNFFPWCVTSKKARNFLDHVDSDERYSFCGASASNVRAEATHIRTFAF